MGFHLTTCAWACGNSVLQNADRPIRGFRFSYLDLRLVDRVSLQVFDPHCRPRWAASSYDNFWSEHIRNKANLQSRKDYARSI